MWNVDERRGVIEVFTNTDHPAFRVTSDIPFYSAIHIAESIAELVERKEVADADEVKEAVLRNATKFMSEHLFQAARA